MFTDDFQWASFQHEMDLKRKLYNDWRGKRATQEEFELPESAALQGSKIKKEKIYARQMYSQRIGRLVPGSTQHLLAERHNLIHFAKPENAGPPTAMTTVVTNAKTRQTVTGLFKELYKARQGPLHGYIKVYRAFERLI